MNEWLWWKSSVILVKNQLNCLFMSVLVAFSPMLCYIQSHLKEGTAQGHPPTAMVTLLKSADDSGWCRTCRFITRHFVVKCFLGFTLQGLYFLQIWGRLYLHCLGILVLWPVASFGRVGRWGLCLPVLQAALGNAALPGHGGDTGNVWEVWEPLLG